MKKPCELNFLWIVSNKMPEYPFQTTNLAFIGCGQIAQNIIKGYLKYSNIPKKNFFICGRNVKKTQRISEKLKVSMILDKEELLEKASVIFICVKPNDMEEVIQSLKAYCHPSHTILSLVAGISFKTLTSWGLKYKRLIRLMPNTSVSIGKGFLPFCSLNNQEALNSFVEGLIKPLGQVLVLEEEDLLLPATVGSSSGLGFILELMQYWLEWLQGEGFSYEQARNLVTTNFLGAAELCRKRTEKSFVELQKEIISPQGVTHSGLKAMRELELERILRLSFEEARLKTKRLELIKKS